MQSSSSESAHRGQQEANVLSEALAALKLVREFNCKHAPALMHLPFFKSMDEAVFNAIASAREVQS